MVLVKWLLLSMQQKDVQERVDFFRIKPVVAGPVWLSKYDLNSKLQTQADDKVAFALAKGVSGRYA